MAGFQIVLLPPLPAAPILGLLLPSFPSFSSCRLRDKTTEQIPRTADLCYGARGSLAGMLTHGDVGVPGSMWLTFTLVEFVQHKRRRLLSLIRLNRRHFKLYRHSYNQEKEA
ncbi:hypothetical protein LI328DRAFT_100707 [Trichoderma asperelloides]|nr:hypothetical protein LI328DRAFT_100707 [Trichoderma asperelloides]